jgi:hypothetical protein
VSRFTHCEVWLEFGDRLHHEWPADEQPYKVWFDYSPGRPGVHTLRNGDPGYPDEPPELVINEIERNNVCLPIINEDGDCIVTEDQYEYIERKVGEWIIEQEENERAEYEEFQANLRSEK